MMKPGRVSIVTGAGSGIGLCTARLLADAGDALVLAARSEKALHEAASSLARRPGAPEPLIVPTDMGNQAAVEALIDRAAGHFGRIDVLVNNAAVAEVVPIAATGAALLRSTMEVNVIGPGIAVQRAWRHFEKQRSGCVVNISSIAALDPIPGFFAYAASKAAISMMGRSVAKEGAAIGVRGFSVAPGAVETPMLRSAFDTKAFPPELCLQPEEVARIVLDCIEGKRDADNGRSIFMMREDGRTRVWTVEGL